MPSRFVATFVTASVHSSVHTLDKTFRYLFFCPCPLPVTESCHQFFAACTTVGSGTELCPQGRGRGQSPSGRICVHPGEAPTLCAFNDVRFDTPFICKSCKLPAYTADLRVLKTVDVFKAYKPGLGRTCFLDQLLTAHGLQCRTRLAARQTSGRVWAVEGHGLLLQINLH